MKKFLSIVIFIILFAAPVFSLELDYSIDAEIKKKYNTNKLNDEVLPSLPSTVSSPSKSSIKSVKNATSTQLTSQNVPVSPKINYKTGAKIPSWTKFKVKSNTKVNNWLAKGSNISFTSTTTVYKNGITLPAGILFTGKITDIHNPQMSGNGALIEISINSMRINGKSVPISGKITKANGKKIFFNSIKGERKYLKNVSNKINKGENFYKKSRKISTKLAANPVGIVLSPIPTITGWAGYAICTVASPITGLIGKGTNISIPAGSEFEIKLLKDAYL